jgi:hypothetical protein
MDGGFLWGMEDGVKSKAYTYSEYTIKGGGVGDTYLKEQYISRKSINSFDYYGR